MGLIRLCGIALPGNGARQTGPDDVRVIAEPPPADALGDDPLEDGFLTAGAESDLEDPLQANVEPVLVMPPQTGVDLVDAAAFLDADILEVAIVVSEQRFRRTRVQQGRLVQLAGLQRDQGDPFSAPLVAGQGPVGPRLMAGDEDRDSLIPHTEPPESSDREDECQARVRVVIDNEDLRILVPEAAQLMPLPSRKTRFGTDREPRDARPSQHGEICLDQWSKIGPRRPDPEDNNDPLLAFLAGGPEASPKREDVMVGQILAAKCLRQPHSPFEQSRRQPGARKALHRHCQGCPCLDVPMRGAFRKLLAGQHAAYLIDAPVPAPPPPKNAAITDQTSQ